MNVLLGGVPDNIKKALDQAFKSKEVTDLNKGDLNNYLLHVLTVCITMFEEAWGLEYIKRVVNTLFAEIEKINKEEQKKKNQTDKALN